MIIFMIDELFSIKLIAMVSMYPVVNKWNKIHNSIFPLTTCTDLVVWNQPGTLGSTIGILKITKYLRDLTYIPSYLIGVYIGFLLRDANINTTGKKR